MVMELVLPQKMIVYNFLCCLQKYIRFLSKPRIINYFFCTGLSRLKQEGFHEVFHKFTREDPSYNIHFDEDTEETLTAGMSELRIRAIV